MNPISIPMCVCVLLKSVPLTPWNPTRNSKWIPLNHSIPQSESLKTSHRIQRNPNKNPLNPQKPRKITREFEKHLTHPDSPARLQLGQQICTQTLDLRHLLNLIEKRCGFHGLHWFRTWEVHGCSQTAGFWSQFSKSAKKGKKREEGWFGAVEKNVIYALHLPEYLVILGDKIHTMWGPQDS